MSCPDAQRCSKGKRGFKKVTKGTNGTKVLEVFYAE